MEISKIASPKNTFAFAITLFFMMLFGFVRRAIYLEILPHFALAVTGAYSVACVGLALVATRFGEISPNMGLVVTSAGFGAGGVIGWYLFRGRRRSTSDSKEPPSIYELCRDHWRYGRWVLGTAILYAGSTSGYPLLVAYVLGFGAASTSCN